MPSFRIPPVSDPDGWAVAVSIPSTKPVPESAVAMQMISDGTWSQMDIGIVVPEGTGVVHVRFPEPMPADDYTVLPTASWTEVIDVRDQTEDGFVLRFARPAPEGGKFMWSLTRTTAPCLYRCEPPAN